MSKKILIIGGVAGGASTAARLRRLDEKAEIIIFERGEYVSYANCGLPYYIGDTITERDNLLVQTPEALNKKFNIDIRIKNEVTKINKEDKKITVKDIEKNSTYEESYDVLVISTGSSPIKPPIEGIDSPNIFTLWTIPDMDNIKAFIDNNKSKKAVVVGGGFIGLEMAENLHALGLNVSLVEMLDQVMTPLDFEMAEILHKDMVANHIDLNLKDGVQKFINKDKTTQVVLQSGKTIDADIVILSIGIKPNGELAANAGLKVNKRGGIIVDEYLKTSDDNIYAIGDVVEVNHLVENNKTMIPLAGPANKQGRICANNICGNKESYKGTQGTSIAKVFDMTAGSTGINEKTLINQGKAIDKDYFVSLIVQKSHAGYYPGAVPVYIKMLFNNEGKILGSQVVGQDGVDKRIDTIATVIRMNGTIYDLMELELAYAPPYSSAKDPVNMAGYTAENILSGKCKFVYPNQVDNLDSNNTVFLDVREVEEKLIGDIPGSVNIPLGQLRNRYNELDKSKLIVVYCAIGVRGYVAYRILEHNGFSNIRNLAGGYAMYENVAKDNNESSVIIDSNNEVPKNMEINVDKAIKVNCSGMQCPGPIMEVNKTVQTINEGDVIEVTASDMGFAKDIESWCKNTGNTLVNVEKSDKETKVYIMKGSKVDNLSVTIPAGGTGKTMVVFSGDLDKAIASFIIANGAKSMGKDVTMFFTFWGLNILRKHSKVRVKKNLIEKMFGMMMPRGAKKLQLSKMHMGGMGSRMIKKIMNDKNVDPLETLISKAIDNGVKIVACTMSMDLMGIKQEELIDGIDYAGVGAYLGAAEESNVNLFI